MVYNSHYNTILEIDSSFSSEKLFDRFQYKGTLEEVLNETETALENNSDHVEKSLTLALNVPRIIRSVLDTKILNPEDKGIQKLFEKALELGISIYSSEEQALDNLRKFRTNISNSNYSNILNAEVVQQNDYMSFSANHPGRSKNTAKLIEQNSSEKDILFIAIAHSGVGVGLDTYLRYVCDTESQRSKFYATRFSMKKTGDTLPRLTEEEIKMLEMKSRGRRQVVIFDEHCDSGGTLDIMKTYFTRKVFPGKKVIFTTNLCTNVRYATTQGSGFAIEKWDEDPLIALQNLVKELECSEEYTF